jgi:hypothetical protein
MLQLIASTKDRCFTSDSAILREINTRGSDSRFTKVERGKFRATASQ